MLDNFAFVWEYLTASPVKIFLKQRVLLTALVVAWLGNIGLWVWLGWRLSGQSDVIFLHYNIAFGVDLIGVWWKVFILPLAGLFILFINTLLAVVLFVREKVLTYFLVWTAVLCQICLWLGSYLIVRINI